MRIHLAENRSAAAASSNEPGDPFYQDDTQWALKNTGQSPPGGTADADIDAERAWNGTTGSSDVVIAVLDTGIPMDGDGDWDEDDLSHPDLDDSNKLIVGPDYAPALSDSASGDGNGIKDEHSHGTHVAGIAAAETNNGTGIAGVCRGCQLMPIQVFNSDGEGTSKGFYKGVKHAVDYAEDNSLELVVNYSGGGDDPSSRAEDAVEYASDHDVPIVTSGGNAGQNEEQCGVEYPAAYSDQYANVVAVAATDHNDDWATYSCEGPELNVAAPGGAGSPFDENDIFSTSPNYRPFDDYRYFAGTSQASPLVAGTAGLMLSVEPSLTASDVRGTLETTSKDLGASGFDEKFGYGRINAFRAVEALFPPLSVSLSGPSQLNSGEEGTWTASVSGGGSGDPSYD